MAEMLSIVRSSSGSTFGCNPATRRAEATCGPVAMTELFVSSFFHQDRDMSHHAVFLKQNEKTWNHAATVRLALDSNNQRNPPHH
jgi:hypothetical protein